MEQYQQSVARPLDGPSFEQYDDSIFPSKEKLETTGRPTKKEKVTTLEALNSTQPYRGLVNQGSTCYLNSLVQALFMTREFRDAIMGLPEDNRYRHVARLRQLFRKMRRRSTKAVSTKNFTTLLKVKVHEQRDVQEFWHELFDALENELEQTGQHNFIADLYKGELKDYVTCTRCRNEDARVITFLDIPLVVKPAGRQASYTTVHESLQAFAEWQLLEGENQSSCKTCKRKEDAHKGLDLVKLPPILTLHLMRFEMDMFTMQRVKVNDRMTFPMRLNMENLVDNKYRIDSANGGPYYELFIIIVHSGTNTHGHYYCYIRSHDDATWYLFNDEHVYRVNETDIESTFGGGPASAYMLMYREQAAHSSNTCDKTPEAESAHEQRQKELKLLAKEEKHLLNTQRENSKQNDLPQHISMNQSPENIPQGHTGNPQYHPNYNQSLNHSDEAGHEANHVSHDITKNRRGGNTMSESIKGHTHNTRKRRKQEEDKVDESRQSEKRQTSVNASMTNQPQQHQHQKEQDWQYQQFDTQQPRNQQQQQQLKYQQPPKQQQQQPPPNQHNKQQPTNQQLQQHRQSRQQQQQQQQQQQLQHQQDRKQRTEQHWQGQHPKYPQPPNEPIQQQPPNQQQQQQQHWQYQPTIIKQRRRQQEQEQQQQKYQHWQDQQLKYQQSQNQQQPQKQLPNQQYQHQLPNKQQQQHRQPKHHQQQQQDWQYQQLQNQQPPTQQNPQQQQQQKQQQHQHQQTEQHWQQAKYQQPPNQQDHQQRQPRQQHKYQQQQHSQDQPRQHKQQQNQRQYGQQDDQQRAHGRHNCQYQQEHLKNQQRPRKQQVGSSANQRSASQSRQSNICMQTSTQSDTDNGKSFPIREEHQYNQLSNAKYSPEHYRLSNEVYNQEKQYQSGQYQHYQQHQQQQDQRHKPIRHQQNQFKPMLSQEELARQRQLEVLADKEEQSLNATRKGNRRSMKHEDNVRVDPNGKATYICIPDGPGVSQISYQRSELHQSQPLDNNCNRLQKSQQRRDQSTPGILRFSADAMLLDQEQHMKGDVRPQQDNLTLRLDARGQYRHRYDHQISPANSQLQPPEPAMDKPKQDKQKTTSRGEKRTVRAQSSNGACLPRNEMSNKPAGVPQLQQPDQPSGKPKQEKNKKNKSSRPGLLSCVSCKSQRQHKSTTQMATSEPNAIRSALLRSSRIGHGESPV